MAHIEPANGVWCAKNAQGHCLATADICVIANGTGAANFSELGAYMRGRCGQLSWAHVGGTLPSVPLSGGAYGAPFHDKLVFGATFDASELDAQPPPVSDIAHGRNRDALAKIAPDLAQRIELASASGRTSIRATTPDQLPIVGKLQDGTEGKFVLCGLGSRGFTTAFLCAEIIASQACGEPCPVETKIALALAPDRFEKRAAKRMPKAKQT